MSDDPIAEAIKAIRSIAATKYGLQGIMEDYSDINAFNYHAKEYFAGLTQMYEASARRALELLEEARGLKAVDQPVHGISDRQVVHPIPNYIQQPMPARVISRMSLPRRKSSTIIAKTDHDRK